MVLTESSSPVHFTPHVSVTKFSRQGCSISSYGCFQGARKVADDYEALFTTCIVQGFRSLPRRCCYIAGKVAEDSETS